MSTEKEKKCALFYLIVPCTFLILFCVLLPVGLAKTETDHAHNRWREETIANLRHTCFFETISEEEQCAYGDGYSCLIGKRCKYVGYANVCGDNLKLYEWGSCGEHKELGEAFTCHITDCESSEMRHYDFRTDVPLRAQHGKSGGKHCIIFAILFGSLLLISCLPFRCSTQESTNTDPLLRTWMVDALGVLSLSDGRQLYTNPEGWVEVAIEGQHSNTDSARRQFKLGAEGVLSLANGQQLYAVAEGWMGVAIEGQYSNTDPKRRQFNLSAQGICSLANGKQLYVTKSGWAKVDLQGEAKATNIKPAHRVWQLVAVAALTEAFKGDRIVKTEELLE